MIRKLQGNSGVKPLECLNPRLNKWAIRWGFKTLDEENGLVEFMEDILIGHKPTLSEIKSLVIEAYNEEIRQKILQGFNYSGNLVWLSTENQNNYKMVFDVAFQTKGSNLPVQFKLGTDENPRYIQFNTLDELQAFHMAWTTFITSTLKDGWERKDKIDWDRYESVLNSL